MHCYVLLADELEREDIVGWDAAYEEDISSDIEDEAPEDDVPGVSAYYRGSATQSATTV